MYAGADLTIFQDISGVCLILSLQSHTYFESAVLCAYFLLLNEICVRNFFVSMVLLLVLNKLFLACFLSWPLLDK